MVCMKAGIRAQLGPIDSSGAVALEQVYPLLFKCDMWRLGLPRRPHRAVSSPLVPHGLVLCTKPSHTMHRYHTCTQPLVADLPCLPTLSQQPVYPRMEKGSRPTPACCHYVVMFHCSLG